MFIYHSYLLLWSVREKLWSLHHYPGIFLSPLSLVELPVFWTISLVLNWRLCFDGAHTSYWERIHGKNFFCDVTGLKYLSISHMRIVFLRYNSNLEVTFFSVEGVTPVFWLSYYCRNSSAFWVYSLMWNFYVSSSSRYFLSFFFSTRVLKFHGWLTRCVYFR